MKLFKKKKKKIKEINKDRFTNKPNIDLSEIPSEALEMIYEHKMDEYDRCNSDREGYMNSERADELQKQLAIMSKYMRQDSMKQTIEYFKEKGYATDKLKETDPEKLRRMKQKLEDLDIAVEGLYKEEPENITINEENTRKTVDEIKDLLKENEDEIESAEKDFDVITSPNDSIENENYIESLEKENQELLRKLDKNKEPEKKSKGFGLFKKKKLVKIKEPTLQKEDVIEQLKKGEPTTIQDRVLEELEKGETKEILAKGGIVKESELKIKLPKTPDIKKIFKKKEGQRDIFCPECKHLMKNHKSGCDKCGCLMDIEDIQKQAGVLVEEVATAKIIEETQKVETPEIIEKQIKQISSMKNIKPEVKKPRLNPNKQCTCEHVRQDHFEMTGFCTIKDCYCDEFRKYPT